MMNNSLTLFLDYFNEKHLYFEAHEVLEELWLNETNAQTKEHPYIILIQLSACLIHWRNNNFIGAKSVFNRLKINYLSQLDNLGKRGILESDFIILINKIDLLLNIEAQFKPFKITYNNNLVAKNDNLYKGM